MSKTTQNELLILYEIGQIGVMLAHFGAERLKSGKGPIIVPIEYEIEISLRERGIPFHSMVGYESRSSSLDRALLVSGLMKQLSTHSDFSFFTYNEIPLGKIVGYSLGEYLLRVLNYLDILSYILDSLKETDAIYMPQSLMTVSSTFGQLAEFEIRAPADVMSFLARERGISLTVIPGQSSVIVEKKLRSIVRLLVRNLLIRAIQLWNAIISLFRTKSAMKIFVSDYWWHIDPFITRMNAIEITMMERKEVQNAKAFLFKYKMRFNHPSGYATRVIKHRAEEKRQYYERTWAALGAHPESSKQCVWYGVNFWEVVRPAYEHLVTFFSKDVVEMIEMTERLLGRQHIQVVILRASMSGQIHFSTFGLVARAMGIPAIELQHGLEWHDEHSLSIYKNVDILASYGPLIKKDLEKVNGTALQVLNIGSPRFDQYRNKVVKKERKDALRRKLGLDETRPVLLYIATDIVPGQAHDTYSMLRLFKNMAAATRSIDGLQVIIKIRPGPAKEFFFKQSLKEAFGEDCVIAQYENMHELISISDIVASSFSTVILEAMIAEKPLVLVGLDKNDRMLLGSHFLPYERANALRIARTKEELNQKVSSIVSNPGEGEEIVRNANNFLKESFCFDGKSAERMADFLETLRK